MGLLYNMFLYIYIELYCVFRIHLYFWPSNALFSTIILVHPCGACELRPRPRPRQKKATAGYPKAMGRTAAVRDVVGMSWYVLYIYYM